jgi:hypothetical protein
VSSSGGLPLPRELADEVAAELLAARRSLVRDEARVEALEALLDLVWTLSRELGRPATLVDVLAPSKPIEREHRRRLVHLLRDHR